MAEQNGKKIRSVDEYLRMLKLAGRSEVTLKNYRAVFTSYAQFLGIPLDEIHKHLSVDNLLEYAASRTGKSKNGRKTTLSILHRYMALNGVIFDELEFNAVKVKADEDRTDKPLELETLQKMMDMGNAHSRAILSFLTSTGCRAGECSKILLSDVRGDTVTIRNEIAKRRKGGKVYLTSEAREFLDIWLRDRDRYIAEANRLTARLLTADTGHGKVPRKDTGKQIERPVNDERLFACSYNTLDKIFGRLYRAVDGEKGKYRAKVTSHSCRAFFRTNAPRGGMSIDLVEGILRHSGYLNAAYVKMTEEDRRKQFHQGEAALFITRADHRVQSGELAQLRQVNAELQERLQRIETQTNEVTTEDQADFEKFMQMKRAQERK